MGLVLLLDNTRSNPLKDLQFFLDAFRELLKKAPLAVGGNEDGYPILTKRGCLSKIFSTE